MKAFLLLFVLFTTVCQANTVESVFNKNSELSEILKVKILVALNEKFPCLSPYSIRETKTEVRVDRVDQGIIDYYYTTTFSVNHDYDYHPRTYTVTVESQDSDFWCEDSCNMTVDKITADYSICE